MRKRIPDAAGLTVNAIAGTYVVFFGLDLAEAQRDGCLGFGFKRTDHLEGETFWLQGLKTFKKTEPHPAPGERYSTHHHPVQAFQWADYSVKPGRTYTYTIVALYDDPANLREGLSVDVTVTTEVETGPTHSVFFNRGSIATQEYARRFQNRTPAQAGQGAYEWLSRGLLEALLAFLKQAGPDSEIHGAVYEFQWNPVLAALKEAQGRGAKVQVLFDNNPAVDADGKPRGPFRANGKAIKDADIEALCAGRAKGKLMHNKFFVLSKGGQPKAVWTGSTNLTENGIFGHSNLGHIVEDDTIAEAFLAYWKRLERDPEIKKPYRDENVAITATPPVPWDAQTVTVFSPRGTNLDALNWYAEIAGAASDALFMTFAFGMHKKFREVYRTNDAKLRMALMEKEWSSNTTKEQDLEEIQRIRNRRNVVVAVGNRIVTNSFDRWIAEKRGLRSGLHVLWVHTKYMLVDPLGAAPIVVSGSANFSKASTDTNDENMLIVKGDKRIADIYFGEYMRLYSHYAFREAVKRYLEKNQGVDPMTWTPQFLIQDDTWMKDYFNPADRSGRFTRRAYFAGPMSE